MLSLRSSRGVTAALKPIITARAVKSAAPQASRSAYPPLLPVHFSSRNKIQSSVTLLTPPRSFSMLTPLRPSLRPTSTGFAPRAASLDTTTTTAATTSSGSEILDLLPKISTHPSLAGIQVRCGPRNTFSPSHFVRKRRHGFLSRVRTRKGRATLQRRKSKNRSTLSH